MKMLNWERSPFGTSATLWRSVARFMVAICSTAVLTAAASDGTKSTVATAPKAGSGPASASASAVSTEVAIRIVPGFEEPLVPAGLTHRDEDAALDKAISLYTKTGTAAAGFPDSVRPFIDFLERHPKTAWRTAIELNLGLGYYRSGYFTLAFAALDNAWQAGRHITEGRAKPVVDRAAGELARMHSRVGNATAVEKILADIKDRHVSGPATELVAGAYESLWRFRNDPGTSYLCGPMAIKNLLISLKADPQKVLAIDQARSGPAGFSLAQVSELATASGLNSVLIYRPPGTPIPVPSVVNWKINHFAAIVGEVDGRYHIQDPTFSSGDFWVSKDVIDTEASGYFLVPSDASSTTPSSTEWRVATAEEANRVHGKGITDNNDPTATKPKDRKTCPERNGRGMCVANAHTMLVSLNLSDVPVGYEPQKGPSALIRLTYNQREAFQPATFGFFNVGPKWNLNLLSWVQDDPVSAGRNVVRYESGGGAVDYRIGYAFNTTTGAFTPELQGGAVLVRVPASGPVKAYEYRQRDGSTWVYGQSDGATTGTRRIFLSRMIDPSGNALVLQYDSRFRLTSMTDATGRSTRFDYGMRSAPLSVTRITDPFGRFASLRYTDQGYLSSITDVIGITSSFAYAGGGAITSMTTPYGTTKFTFGQNTTENSRYLTITDPMGFTERVEFRHQAPGISDRDAVPGGMPGVVHGYLDWRNTFYWDKHAYATAPTDYTKARITHWLHGRYPEGRLTTSPVVESTKAPLESRVWYAYPPQQAPDPIYQGSTASPIAIGSIAGGTSRLKLSTLDAFGTPISTTDAIGRLTTMSYDASGIDLLSVGKRIDGVIQKIAEFTYNAQHRPLTSRDAAGRVTQYAYNSAGQLTTQTDQLGRTQTYIYDSLGRLTQIINANGKMHRSVSYDAFDRIATSTDSEGYVLAHEYDALDRITKVAYPDATTTRYTYSKLDLVAVTDRLGRTTKYGYDSNRRITSVTDPLGLTTRYTYHETDVLKSITDPRGNVTRWDIDVQSRPIVKTFADGKRETYSYDEGSRRFGTTNAAGRAAYFLYKADDRLASVTYVTSGQSQVDRFLHWDPSLPRLTQVDSIQYGYDYAHTKFSYHPVGSAGALQLAAEDNQTGDSTGPRVDRVTYGYDSMGRLSSRSAPGGSETFEYDNLDRISTHGTLLGAFTNAYLGQTRQLTSQGTGRFGTQWEYKSNLEDRRLSRISGSTTAFAYQTSTENRIDGIHESGTLLGTRNWSFQYDADDRLVRGQLQSIRVSDNKIFPYGYDDSDNLVSIAGAHNSVNQPFNAAYRYDDAGNLIEDSSRTFGWDAESRLIFIGYKGSGNFTRLLYDGLGRRTGIKEFRGSVERYYHYVWCGNTICSSYDGLGDTRRYYEEGEFRSISDGKYYYGKDHLGSIRSVVDVSVEPDQPDSFNYDPYGNTLTSRDDPSPHDKADFRYAGMLFHGPSGLYLTKYRAYDSGTGRWLSRDPIGETGGENLYAYVQGNPVNTIDREGLEGSNWWPDPWDDRPTWHPPMLPENPPLEYPLGPSPKVCYDDPPSFLPKFNRDPPLPQLRQGSPDDVKWKPLDKRSPAERFFGALNGGTQPYIEKWNDMGEQISNPYPQVPVRIPVVAPMRGPPTGGGR